MRIQNSHQEFGSRVVVEQENSQSLEETNLITSIAKLSYELFLENDNTPYFQELAQIKKSIEELETDIENIKFSTNESTKQLENNAKQLEINAKQLEINELAIEKISRDSEELLQILQGIEKDYDRIAERQIALLEDFRDIRKKHQEPLEDFNHYTPLVVDRFRQSMFKEANDHSINNNQRIAPTKIDIDNTHPLKNILESATHLHEAYQGLLKRNLKLEKHSDYIEISLGLSYNIKSYHKKLQTACEELQLLVKDSNLHEITLKNKKSKYQKFFLDVRTSLSFDSEGIDKFEKLFERRSQKSKKSIQATVVSKPSEKTILIKLKEIFLRLMHFLTHLTTSRNFQHRNIRRLKNPLVV